MNWQRTMNTAICTAQVYGIRTRVFGKRGPRGWYYQYSLVPRDQKQIQIKGR